MRGWTAVCAGLGRDGGADDREPFPAGIVFLVCHGSSCSWAGCASAWRLWRERTLGGSAARPLPLSRTTAGVSLCKEMRRRLRGRNRCSARRFRGSRSAAHRSPWSRACASRHVPHRRVLREQRPGWRVWPTGAAGARVRELPGVRRACAETCARCGAQPGRLTRARRDVRLEDLLRRAAGAGGATTWARSCRGPRAW